MRAKETSQRKSIMEPLFNVVDAFQLMGLNEFFVDVFGSVNASTTILIIPYAQRGQMPFKKSSMFA